MDRSHPTRTRIILRLRLAGCALVAVSSAAGCASATRIPDADRIALERTCQGRVLQLRASLWVMPFFSDPARRLVSPLPPDSIEMLLDPSGAPILPGAPDGMLELGTRVHIERVEFPTSLAVTRRPLYSPRTETWVYFRPEGVTSGAPYVAVLRSGIRTREEFTAAFDALFATDDPTAWIVRYTPEVRAAIRAKRLVTGMDAAAVELAWGKPERILVSHPQGSPVAEWIWPLGKRRAMLRDDRLVSATPGLE